MIIRDLDVKGVAVNESKTDAPLVVNRNRILPFTIMLQLMQTIAGRNPQIRQTRGVLDILEFSNRPSNEIRREPFRPAQRVEFPGRPIRKGFDHTLNVNYHVTRVKLGNGVQVKTSITHSTGGTRNGGRSVFVSEQDCPETHTGDLQGKLIDIPDSPKVAQAI